MDSVCSCQLFLSDTRGILADPVSLTNNHLTMKPILETNLAIYFIKCQRGELSTVHFLQLHQLNPPPSPPLTDDKY